MPNICPLITFALRENACIDLDSNRQLALHTTARKAINSGLWDWRINDL